MLQALIASSGYRNVLSGVGLVVHEEKVEVTGVVDDESLVAGRHHVAGLLVGAVTDLFEIYPSASLSCSPMPSRLIQALLSISVHAGKRFFAPLA